MQQEKFCQSCSMPLGAEQRGFEKDGSKSNEYCKFCYQNGELVNPEMTLQEMNIKLSAIMKDMNFDDKVIDMTLRTLPTLKRWRKKEIAS